MREYKYEGEAFELDDPKGCYIEVTYRGQKGYVGGELGLRTGRSVLLVPGP